MAEQPMRLSTGQTSGFALRGVKTLAEILVERADAGEKESLQSALDIALALESRGWCITWCAA